MLLTSRHRKNISFSLFAFLTFISVRAYSQDSRQTFAQIRPFVYEVRTASSATAEKKSYGSAFVLHRNGLLATNFHVIADAIWKSPREKIFYVKDGKRLPAQILGVDIRNDLAILQVEEEFLGVVEFSQKTPKIGDRVYSLGLPEDLDWTLVSGVYNGEIQQGPYQLLHLSAPINSGMSGGPTVNEAGKLVGINVARRVGSQNISFAIPATYLQDLLKKIETRNRRIVDPMVDISENIQQLNEDLTEILMRGFQQSKIQDNWSLPVFDNSIRCWGHELDEFNGEKLKGTVETCEVEQSLFIDGEKYFGTFKVRTNKLHRKQLSFLSWNFFKNKSWGKIDLAQFLPITKDSAINFSKPICQENRVLTKQGTVQVRSCVQNIIPFDDIFEAEIAMRWENQNDHLVVATVISGVSQKNLTRIIRIMLEGPLGKFHAQD